MASHDVLIVEDDPPTRVWLASAIERHRDLVLAGAVGSCREAREALERLEPAVLLTDLGLPRRQRHRTDPVGARARGPNAEHGDHRVR
ncbi:MAG: hypothetical protein M5U32_16480 [Myxococcota bacterium]|nr:hypothetical protein [Myxococcota bacterium]